MDDMVMKPYIILQARMGSKRLPGKAMKRISDKPIIGILIDRLKEADIPILLATSTNAENDELVYYVESLGVRTFRGSEDNVLERFYLASKCIDANIIIRLTGDNVLIDGNFVRSNYERYIQACDKRTYLSTSLSQTFPVGMSVEIFSSLLLEEAHKNASLPGELEHVTPYMYNDTSRNIKILKVRRDIPKHDYRLTVDTREDFELTRELIEKYSCGKKSMDEIISVLDDNEGLALMNKETSQKKWDE